MFSKGVRAWGCFRKQGRVVVDVDVCGEFGLRATRDWLVGVGPGWWVCPVEGVWLSEKGVMSVSLGRVRVLSAAVVAVVLGLLVVVGSAWGTVGHVSVGGFGGAAVFEGGPSGVGVGVSGVVFGSDPGLFSGQRVERFDGSGGPLGLWGVDGSQFVGLGAVAVDSGVGGGVYVMGVDPNTSAPSVVKFSESGVVEHALDVSGSSLSINNNGPVAVDPASGTVWVAATDSTDPNAPSAGGGGVLIGCRVCWFRRLVVGRGRRMAGLVVRRVLGRMGRVRCMCLIRVRAGLIGIRRLGCSVRRSMTVRVGLR